MRADPWESGNPYEFFMGRWSRPVAHRFLEWLSMAEHQRWLEVGCGTGVLSSKILEITDPDEVLAIDSSDTFIAFAKQSLQDIRIRFQVGEASRLSAETDYFDGVVSGLALNFFPNPLITVSEMVRSTHTGGMIAAYVWDYAKKMQMLRYFWDVAIKINPAAKKLDEGERFPLCQPAALEALFKKAGLKNVTVRAIDVPTVFKDFNEYWLPFLGGQGPAPGYVMSLINDERSALEEKLRTVLPMHSDGTIALTARAWAVRGIV